MGTPKSPQNPLAPRPDGLENPYTLNGHEKIGNPGAWQLWWEFNQDRFLRYSSINTGGSVLTQGADWEIGRGAETGRVGGRLTSKNIQDAVVPAIREGIKAGGSEEFLKSAMMAMAKIGGTENEEAFEFFLHFYLNNGHATINETAAVALGLASGPKNLALLTSIAKNEAKGQEFLGRKEVPMGMRAFAAYGLGFAASRSNNESIRRQAVADLIDVLEEVDEDEKDKVAKGKKSKKKNEAKDEDETLTVGSATRSDLQVASMVSIGLIPLNFESDVEVCICGTCEVENPDTSYQAQVTYLMRYFTANEEFDANVRAHTASTLGRLVLAGGEMAGTKFHSAINEIKLGTAEILADSLARSAAQPQAVKNSAIMALGLMGDADNEDVDRWIRSELKRQAAKGGPLGKRFALMSLAEVGSRRGQGDDLWGASNEVRMELMSHLSRAKRDVRPWAGLALGVFGYQRSAQGQELDSGVDRALAKVAKSSKTASDLGAYSVALGLRKSDAGTAMLSDKLNSTKDSTARSYVALGLGLSGNRTAVANLQDTLETSDREPLVQTRTGLALGLLGDAAVVEELTHRLQKTRSKEKRASIAMALGFIGDKRSLEALVGMLEVKGDAQSPTRDAAMQAIGYMSDRTSTPWRSVLAHGTNYLAETRTLLNGRSTGVLNLK
ncbi:MAG: HEAT repeat domain-containing protein [Planctomycetota bacterium]|nr:HEAT repeat domain-containing protein [Planctomycetota bacterium]